MKSFNEYMEVISKNCLDLKKDDNVFIVLPSEMKYLKYHVISYLNSNGITNITVYEDNELFKDNNLRKIFSSVSKLLLFTNDNRCNQYIALLDDLEAYGVDLIYTIAAIPNKGNILNSDIDKLSSLSNEKSFINWRIINSKNNKKIMQLQNLGIKDIKITKSIKDELSFNINGEYENISKRNQMRMFPNYAIRIFTNPNTVNGFIDATAKTFIEDSAIDDLRLMFEKGTLIDYDCLSSFKKANDYLGKRCIVKMEALGLAEIHNPSYNIYGVRNNYVLDRVSSPYIFLSSHNLYTDEHKFIYVPIAAGTLKVVGFDKEKKKTVIYENEEFTKKINTQKK